jgi:RNA polymerase sigma factor (TIGR02999 family)
VPHELESLIERADHADREAAERLFAILYQELHKLAEHSLRGAAGSALTLGATTLLHEVYLDIAGRESLVFVDRSRFMAYAARAMRGLVIDYARRRRAKKRGRQLQITLDETEDLTSSAALQQAAELEQLSDALDELSELEPALAELVDLHFFSGFSFGEIATLRHVSERTVQRDWRKARMLLHHALLHDDTTPPNELP